MTKKRGQIFGLKVFMDAHQPVTLKEGDRYPLGPPSLEVFVEPKIYGCIKFNIHNTITSNVAVEFIKLYWSIGIIMTVSIAGCALTEHRHHVNVFELQP